MLESDILVAEAITFTLLLGKGKHIGATIVRVPTDYDLHGIGGNCWKPKTYISELISNHLKPISYDRWAELHWKKQLEEDLAPAE